MTAGEGRGNKFGNKPLPFPLLVSLGVYTDIKGNQGGRRDDNRL